MWLMYKCGWCVCGWCSWKCGWWLAPHTLFAPATEICGCRVVSAADRTSQTKKDACFLKCTGVHRGVAGEVPDGFRDDALKGLCVYVMCAP